MDGSGFENLKPRLVLTGITKRYPSVVANEDVSLSVHPGEIHAVLGENGAGKSTLMKMLTTILPPTSGVALVAGFDVARQPAAVRRHIGYVPQVLSADGDLTGYENMQLSAGPSPLYFLRILCSSPWQVLQATL